MSDTSIPVAGPGLLRINVPAHEVWCGERSLKLTRMEFRVLVELARNEGAFVSRQQLLTHVWGTPWRRDTRTVGTHVYKLRRQLGDDGSLIRGVKSVGYMLAAGTVAELVGEPDPPAAPAAGEALSALDLAQVLQDSIAGLRSYIEQRADEIAADRTANLTRQAEQLRRALAEERQRRQDLAATMRRQIGALERQLEQARAGSKR